MYNPSFSGSIQFWGLNFNACFISQFCMFRFKCMRLAEFLNALIYFTHCRLIAHYISVFSGIFNLVSVTRGDNV